MSKANDDAKTDVWMPLWIGAYLADTMKLTTLQHGAYFLLLLAYWRERAPLADNDDELRSITKTEKAEWKKLRPVLAKFFKVGDGVWWHKRVEKEMAEADKRSKAASKKASDAANARWKKGGEHESSDAPSMPGALPEHMLNECPTPSPIPNPSDSSVPNGTGGTPPAQPVDNWTREEVWAAGKAHLIATGTPLGQCFSVVDKFRLQYGDEIAMDAMRSVVKNKPLEPIPYLSAECSRLSGYRVKVPDRWWATQDGIIAMGKSKEIYFETSSDVAAFITFTAKVWLAAGDGPWINQADRTTYGAYQRLELEAKAKALEGEAA